MRTTEVVSPDGRLLRRELDEGGSVLCLVPSVIYEFLHVVTDPRRFAKLLEMAEAAGVRRLATFNGRDFQVFPFIEVVEPA